MRRAFLLLVVLAGGVIALDQWTKRWATEHLAHRPPVELLGDALRLTYTRNSGVAFGLGAGVRFPYYLFSIAAAVIIIAMFLRGRARTLRRQVALSLIFGGAIGNLVDRLGSGEVVDFIEVGWSRWHWPVFNVADSAVTIGVLLFAMTWQRSHEPAIEAAGSGEPAASGAPSPHDAPPDEPTAGPFGPGAQQRGAVGPLPGGGADGPLA